MSTVKVRLIEDVAEGIVKYEEGKRDARGQKMAIKSTRRKVGVEVVDGKLKDVYQITLFKKGAEIVTTVAGAQKMVERKLAEVIA